MTTVDLTINKGFQWYIKKKCQVKGYLFDLEQRFYKDEGLLDYFGDVNSENDFINRLKNASGLFSVVLSQKDEVYIGVDITRTFPLFYIADEAWQWIGDDPARAPLKKEINRSARTEFLATGYVTGNETLIDGLNQLQAGQYVLIKNNNLKLESYTNYLCHQPFQENTDYLSKYLENLIYNVFNRYLKAFEDHFIALPLSGGYDSRLIACMLKHAGFKNVLCYTYGRQGNGDTLVSEKVAKQLGFKWMCIKYDDALIKNYLEDPVFQEYYKYSSTYVSQFFMQEYFAVKHLHEQGYIPKSTVFMPGHSGDFLGGSHLTGMIKAKAPVKNIIQEIYDRNYILNPVKNKDKKGLKRKIASEIRNGSALAWPVVENWDWKERQAKFIVNSCNVYPFFNYQFALPFWDRQLFSFFKGLRFEMKFNKAMYDKVLLKTFRAFNVEFDTDTPLQHPAIWKTKLKRFLKRHLPFPIHSHLRKPTNDPFFYGPITRYMIEDMERKGQPVQENVHHFNAIIAQWYINQIS